MNKIEMREWIASLDEMISNKLRKWMKQNPIENGESVRLAWQFEQTTMKLYIFWEDKKELIKLKCEGPRIDNIYLWHGLDDKTFNKVADRVGNLAQVTMHPPIDPLDTLD